MAHYEGKFFGYREKLIVRVGMVYMPPPMMPIQGPHFEFWMFNQQSYSSARYKATMVTAEDDYPADFTMIDSYLGDMTSRQVMISVFDNPVDIIMTYDGTTPLSQRFFEAGYIGIEAIKGFKVRNFLPGRQSRCQIVVFT